MHQSSDYQLTRREYRRAGVRSRWVQAIGSGIQGTAFATRLHRNRVRWHRFVGTTHDRLAVRRTEIAATRFQATRHLQLAFKRSAAAMKARTAWRINVDSCSRRGRRAVSRGGDFERALGRASTSGEESLRYCNSYDQEAVSARLWIPRTPYPDLSSIA